MSFLLKVVLAAIISTAIVTILSIVTYKVIRRLRRAWKAKKPNQSAHPEQSGQQAASEGTGRDGGQSNGNQQRILDLGLARQNPFQIIIENRNQGSQNPNENQYQVVLGPDRILNNNSDVELNSNQVMLQQNHQELWGYNILDIFIREQLHQQQILSELENRLMQVVHNDRIQRLLADKTEVYNFNAAFMKETQCIICFEDYKNEDEVREINHCKHMFHDKCLSEWIKRSFEHPVCPLCKHDLNE